MLDAELISSVIASREAWELVHEHISDKDLSPNGGFWYKIIGDLYSSDKSASCLSTDVVIAYGETRITNPKHRESLLSYISGLPDSKSPAATGMAALHIKRHVKGLELAGALGQGDDKRVASLHAEYGALLAAESLRLVCNKGGPTEWKDAKCVEDLFGVVGQENRIPLAPASLNERIGGGALPGQHILIFGRPEAGKSLFAINLAGSLVRRGQRVMYVGNEDQIDILKSRMLCRITNMTFAECEKDKDKAAKLFRDRGGEDRLLMTQMIERGSIASLRKRVDEWKPTVLVLDQIRNLESDQDSMTKALEQNAIGVRRLLLEYGLIGISVTQANDRSAGYGQRPPLYLSMADVDNSRTGLPGQCDLMLGIGYNEEMLARNQRQISIPKNKLSSAPNAREGFVVEFDLQRSKVR